MTDTTGILGTVRGWWHADLFGSWRQAYGWAGPHWVGSALWIVAWLVLVAVAVAKMLGL